MDQREVDRVLELLEALKRRKHERELQVARLGVSADPVIPIEIQDIEEQITYLSQSLSSSATNYQLGTPELDNFEGSPPPIGIVAAGNNLGRGITLGGTYRKIALRVVATGWVGYGISWMRSGWLFAPQFTHSHAVAFFKLHVQDEGSGYIHILAASDPNHTIWLTTAAGFKKEGQFHYTDHPMAIWPFNWK